MIPYQVMLDTFSLSATINVALSRVIFELFDIEIMSGLEIIVILNKIRFFHLNQIFFYLNQIFLFKSDFFLTCE